MLFCDNQVAEPVACATLGTPLAVLVLLLIIRGVGLDRTGQATVTMSANISVFQSQDSDESEELSKVHGSLGWLGN